MQIQSLLVSAVVLATSGVAAAQVPSIRSHNRFPNSTGSLASAISGNGLVAVGISGNPSGPYRWTEAGGIQTLPGTLPLSGPAVAAEVNFDGSVIAGPMGNETNCFRWTPSGGFTTLFAPGTAKNVNGMSADGNTIIASAGNSVLRTLTWTPSGVTTLNGLYGMGLSSNGNVITGYSAVSSQPTRAAYWSASTGIVNLPGTGPTWAEDANADGSVIVGTSNGLAVMWTAAGMTDLGSIVDASPRRYYARAVNGDGSVIVGSSTAIGPNEGPVPWIWTAATGMLSLDEALTNAGVDLTVWTLNDAADISADGRSITGWGGFGGRFIGYTAVIPAPGTLGLLVVSGLVASRRRRQ